MDDTELQAKLAERFKALPKSVQDAITSADVEAHLRTLSDTYKLHLDQWAILENEVMLTMLGFQKTQDLAKNIRAELGLEESAATALAGEISNVVFAPIRAELEQVLPEPEGSSSAEGALETRSIPVGPSAPKPMVAPVIAATPPRATPEKKVERAPTSPTYIGAVPSHQRAAIEGDPYREQVA